MTLTLTTTGLIKLISLHVTAIKVAHESSARDRATIYTAGMIKQITTNHSESLQGTYSLRANTNSPPSNACVNSKCTAKELANFDMANWNYAISQSLPSGTGKIATTVDSDNGTTKATVTVYWDQDRDGETGINCNNEEYDLDCIQASVSL